MLFAKKRLRGRFFVMSRIYKGNKKGERGFLFLLTSFLDECII